MTTDLKDKTVSPQRWTSPAVEPNDAGGFVAYDDYLELAHRLEEAQKQLELYAAEMSEARAAGFYSAQELWNAYKPLEKRNATHDAETAAKALEEALERFYDESDEFGRPIMQDTVKEMIAEYRAKAKGEKP